MLPRHSSERKQQHMRQLFEEIDADGNGEQTRQEHQLTDDALLAKFRWQT